MKAVSSNLQSLDANSFSSFSSDVFIDLSDNREPLSSWSDFIAGSIAGKLIRIFPFEITFGHNNNFLSKKMSVQNLHADFFLLTKVTANVPVLRGDDSLTHFFSLHNRHLLQTSNMLNSTK